MSREKAYLERVGLLVGEDVLARLGEVRVLLFGAGGVGSWCAEGLVRSGVRHLTLVDADVISESNVGRQLMATPRTVGQVKVEALRDRLLEVAPDAEITVYQKIFSAETADEFAMAGYDYILDAIDSLKDKGELILARWARPCARNSSRTIPGRDASSAVCTMRRCCPTGAARVRRRPTCSTRRRSTALWCTSPRCSG